MCGNGTSEPGEECDDGNLVDSDGCSSTCTLDAFGQSIIDAFFSSEPAVDCSSFLTGVTLSVPDSRMLKVKSTYGASAFPTQGSDFIILASGDPDAPAETADLDPPPVTSGSTGCGGDTVQLTFTFDFPDDGFGDSVVKSLGFNFDFFTYEYPEPVGSGGFNDAVFAYLDAAPLTLPSTCVAPTAPAQGCLVTFDTMGDPTNVASAFLQGCDVLGCDLPSGTPGWDNIFTTVPGDDAGRTGTLTTCTPSDCALPVPPGTHTLTLLVNDAVDGIFTTAGLFDNLQCFSDLECMGS